MIRLKIEEPIEQWFENCKEEIWAMQTTLAEPWSTEPALIDMHISDLGRFLERANELHCEAVTFHHHAMHEKMPSREEYKTDLDRTAVVKSLTTTERRLRDTMEGIVRAIDQQVNNGRCLRKGYIVEGKSGHRDD